MGDLGLATSYCPILNITSWPAFRLTNVAERIASLGCVKTHDNLY